MPAAIAGEEKYPYPASGLEKAIGYTFRNQELLLNALRHSSYSNETKKMQNASNERLEFLGDSVLSVIVSDYIYRNYADLDEGDLTKIRASVVCENSLAALAARLELGRHLSGRRHRAGARVPPADARGRHRRKRQPRQRGL